MRQKSYTSQSGATMMEMLVVIMLIGVIGSSGIIGIGYALNVFRAWSLQAKLPQAVKNIESVYAFHTDCTGLTMTSICDSNVLDDQFERCVDNVYKTEAGDLTIECLNKAKDFKLTFSAVPKTICSTLKDNELNTHIRMTTSCDDDVQTVIFTTEPESSGD